MQSANAHFAALCVGEVFCVIYCQYMYRESTHGFDSSSSHENGHERAASFDSQSEAPRLSATERRLVMHEAIQCLKQALDREPDLLGGDLPLRKDIASALRVLSIPDYPEAAIRLLEHALEREPDILAGDLPLRRDVDFALHMLNLLTVRS